MNKQKRQGNWADDYLLATNVSIIGARCQLLEFEHKILTKGIDVLTPEQINLYMELKQWWAAFVLLNGGSGDFDEMLGALVAEAKNHRFF